MAKGRQFFIEMQVDKVAAAQLVDADFTTQFQTVVEARERYVYLREVAFILGAGTKQWFVEKVWRDATVQTIIDSGGNTTNTEVAITGDAAETLIAPGERIRLRTTGTVVNAKGKLYLEEA
jgi:hypothetical protein